MVLGIILFFLVLNVPIVQANIFDDMNSSYFANVNLITYDESTFVPDQNLTTSEDGGIKITAWIDVVGFKNVIYKNREYYIKKDLFLFCWNEVHGNGTQQFIESLSKKYNFDLGPSHNGTLVPGQAKLGNVTAKIEKTGSSLKITNGLNYILLLMNNNKTKKCRPSQKDLQIYWEKIG